MKNPKGFRLLIFLSVTLILIVGITCILLHRNKMVLGQRARVDTEKQDPSVFLKNERLKYAINLRGIKIGRAELAYLGPTMIQNQKAELFIFSSRAINFYDAEKIYASPLEFIPLRIERELNFWGMRMSILEEYNQKENLVNITKTQGKKINKNTIKFDSNVQNIISLVYKYRAQKELKIGQVDTFNLPTKKIAIKVTRLESIKVPAGIFNAYLLESDTGGYRFWLSAEKDRLPLKLQGFSHLGSTSLVLSSTE